MLFPVLGGSNAYFKSVYLRDKMFLTTLFEIPSVLSSVYKHA